MNVYPFIEAEKVDSHNVKRACELLQVSRSAYYQHRADQPSAREQSDAELTAEISQIHADSKGPYGAPRIHAQLRRRGYRVARKRVARLMRAAGLRGKTPKRWRRTTIPDPSATVPPDLIRRDFAVDAADDQHPLVRRHHLHPHLGRAGSTWPPSSTSPPAGSSAGPSPTTCAPTWSPTPSPTPSPAATPTPG